MPLPTSPATNIGISQFANNPDVLSAARSSAIGDAKNLALGAGILQGAGGAIGQFGDFMSARRNARLVMDIARANASRIRTTRTRQLGAARAAVGASGFQRSGSPLDVLADQAMEAELDVRLALFQGKVQQAEQESRARRALVGVGTSLLGGLSTGLINRELVGLQLGEK